MDHALANMLHATPTDGPFITDLSKAVTNSASPEAGATWLLGFIGRYLERQGLASGPIAAFDFAIYDLEALDRAWPAFILSETYYRETGKLDGNESPLPQIARFLIERMPAIWDGPRWTMHHPETRAVVLADRIDTLVGFFGAGIMPTGSKDPYAIRRTARHLLMQIMFPVTKELAA